MFKFIFILLSLIASAAAFSDELYVLDLPGSKIQASDSIYTAFQIDIQRGTVIAEVKVQRITTRSGPGPGGYGDVSVDIETILKGSAPVPGLSVVDDELIYKSEEKTVVCARIGKTRILRRTRLRLTGFCELEAQLARVNGSKRLLMKFFADEI